MKTKSIWGNPPKRLYKLINLAENKFNKRFNACIVGCSDGKFLMPFARKGYIVTGYDIDDIINDIKESKKRGKKNYIIINAEGVGDSVNLAKTIEERTGMETRATILGHMQRGGSPTCKDRVYASIMGSMAVDLLLEGKTNRIVGYRHGEYVDFDIEEALGMQKGIPEYQYEISKKLSL